MVPIMLQAKRAYEKSSKEANEAFQSYQKADKDMNMTKLQIEKVEFTSKSVKK